MWYTMIKKNDYMYLKIILYVLTGIIFFILFYKILSIINAYYYFVFYIIIILYLLLGLFLLLKKKQLCIIIYYVMLFVLLFLRNTEPGINLHFYLFEWLKNIFTNKIIFINNE